MADSLRAAHRLLRVADVQQQYEAATQRQIQAIIRSYSSIVAMSADLNLPHELTQQINDCYVSVYAWENFEEGLAGILAENFDDSELKLLTDFYGNLGLPPTEIDKFKTAIAKSAQIQATSLEFMWTNSASCVEQDTALILDYIASQQSPAITTIAIE